MIGFRRWHWSAYVFWGAYLVLAIIIATLIYREAR